MDAAEAKRRIAAEAEALGFVAVGFARPDPGEAHAARLAAFVADGRHGTMGWLAARTAERADPKALWPEVRTVIALGTSYAPADGAALAPPERATLSVYARRRDYHDVIKGRLKHLAQYVAAKHGAGVKVFCDTAPVAEKPLAERAGIGWQGKHTNLVSRAHGSWLWLGEVFTTLDLPPDPPHADRCGSCARCIAACPTDAFPAPYQLDARRCVSYLTIEHEGPIPEALRPGIGNRVFGCDDCLAVCPWNRFAVAARDARLALRPDLAAMKLATLAALDDAAFRDMFAGTPVRRAGYGRFLRNVLVAVGNAADPALIPVAAAHRQNADPVVADAADWAFARLQRGTDFAGPHSQHGAAGQT